MRTVHETEALRPSDPVPKHHSSNPSNKFQRLKLVLTNEGKKGSQDKGSTPASPSVQAQAPNSATGAPAPGSDAEYAHNNVIYLQDLASPNAPTMVQFPPDLEFTPEELGLPAPDLFKLLRRQLHWATQDGEELRAEADRLDKVRKEEWEAKELLVENYMEATVKQVERQREENGLPAEYEGFSLAKQDVIPSKRLQLQAKNGNLPWWRDGRWAFEDAGTTAAKDEDTAMSTDAKMEEHLRVPVA